MAANVKPFWQRKTLLQMSKDEWESLCDGCGLCCLQKLIDDDSGGVYYTNVACKLLDLDNCQCKNYSDRKQHVPDCVQLTAKDVESFSWLPQTCAYRLLAQGEDLPVWHRLRCGRPQAVHEQGISLLGRMQSELEVAEENWEQHLIFRSA